MKNHSWLVYTATVSQLHTGYFRYHLSCCKYCQQVNSLQYSSNAACKRRGMIWRSYFLISFVIISSTLFTGLNANTNPIDSSALPPTDTFHLTFTTSTKVIYFPLCWRLSRSTRWVPRLCTRVGGCGRDWIAAGTDRKSLIFSRQ